MAFPAPKIAPTPQPPTAANHARARIMVVDDLPPTREIIALILNAEFDILELDNGLSAWERIEGGDEFKAIITDIDMPGLDGIELITRIRKSADPHIRDLPIIVITGADDQETRRRAFVSGATGLIIKPIDTVQLQALLHAYVQHDDVKRELEQKSMALEEQSVIDALTGLRSRRYLMDRGAQDLAFSKRREKDLAVIRIDIDRFAEIRQSHDKERIDALLKWLGRLLLDNARTEDTVARLGDAEFAILAMTIDFNAAMVVCNRLRDTVTAKPFSDGNLTVPITFNIGVANLEKDKVQSFEALLALAQERLAQPQRDDNAPQPISQAPATPILETPAQPVAVTVAASEPCAADPIETLSVQELEQLIRQEVTAKTGAVANPDVSADATSPLPLELVSIESALQLLADGKGDVVHPHLEQLIRRIQPLLEYQRAQRAKK